MMNRSERDKVYRLERRRAHLQERVGTASPGELSYDHGEIAALSWALEVIADAYGVRWEADRLPQEDAVWSVH